MLKNKLTKEKGSFEEEFPSLKGKAYWKRSCFPEKQWLWVEDVEEHCLDKERVKQAIFKVIPSSHYRDGVELPTWQFRDKIFKELGL